MKPPRCAICDRNLRSDPETKFDTVRFSNFESMDHPGHPRGLVWFCDEHLEQARELKSLESHEAIKQIKESEESLIQRVMKKFKK